MRQEAARQDIAHRLLRALRLPFGLPFGREHFVVYTDYHRKKSVCSVYSVFILYQMVVSIAWLSKLE